MKTYVNIRHVLAGIIVLLLSGTPVFAAPDIQHWKTSNGARVYFVPALELPMVDIQIVFDAGSARDMGKNGLARLTGALLAEGTGEMSADQIAEQFAQLGANFGVEVERDMAVVKLRSLTDGQQLEPAIKLFAQVLGKPSFPVKALERERQRTLIGLKQEKQSPASIVGRQFYQAAYGTHPYATPPEGEEATVNAISRDEIVGYHQQYYVARNAVVAIVGALDKRQAKRLARMVTAQLETGDAAAALPPVPDLAQSSEQHIAYPSAQTHVRMGQPGSYRGDPDYFPLYVGNHILGGSGLVSRLSEEVREKRGLSYSVYSYFMPLRQPGLFTIGLQTKSEQTSEALDVVRSEIQRFIEHGPAQDEVQAAKKNITGGFALRISSNSKIVGYIAMIGFYGLPLDYLDRFNASVEAVTLAQIKDAFSRRVHPDKMVTVTVGKNGQAPAETPPADTPPADMPPADTPPGDTPAGDTSKAP